MDTTERLYELAVFVGNNKIPFKFVSMIWYKTAGMSVVETEELCMRFYNKSLISSLSMSENYIILHDNIMSYIIADVNKNQEFIREINSVLIRGLCDKYGDDLLDVPEGDLYIWKNIVKYCVRSGSNIKALLLLKNYLWLKRKIGILGVSDLLDDFLAVKLDGVANKIFNALLLSKDVICEYPDELSAQLWGRLAYDKGIGISEFLVEVRRDVEKKYISMLFPSLTPVGREKFKLVGHDERVNSSVYCNLDKSNSIITNSDDKTLRIWDGTLGFFKNRLVGHEDRVSVVLCSNNGYMIFSGSDDYSVNIYYVLTGEMKKLSYHTDVVNAVKVTNGDDKVVTASADGTSCVWSANKGEIIWELDNGVISVNDVCLSIDGKVAVTVSSDKKGRVWNMSTGGLLFELLGHTDAVKKVIITPDCKNIISVSNDSTVRIWSAEDGRELNVFERHKKAVNFIDCSYNGKYFVTSSDDNTAVLWDINKRKALKILDDHTYPINVARFSQDDKFIVTASSDNTACLWSVVSGKKYSVLKGHDGEVLDARFSDDGLQVVTASSDNSAKVWFSKRAVNPRRIKSFHNEKINYLSFSKHNELLASASDDKKAKIWSVRSGCLLAELSGHKYGINMVTFSPNSRLIATASSDNTVFLWGIDDYKKISVNPIIHQASVNYVSFSPDSSKIVTASDDNCAIIYDLNVDDRIISLEGHDSFVNYSIFSPDGQYVLTCSGDTTARIWSSFESSDSILLEGHEAWITKAKYLLNGEKILTTSGDGTVRIWNVNNPYDVTVIPFVEKIDDLLGTYYIVCSDVSYDFLHVYAVVRYAYDSLDYYWKIIVWDINENKLVMSTPPQKGFVTDAAFVKDGLSVVMILKDYSLRYYDLDDFCEEGCLHFDYQPTALSLYDKSVAVGDNYGRVHICGLA